jgi:hypothetical protein
MIFLQTAFKLHYGLSKNVLTLPHSNKNPLQKKGLPEKLQSFE